MFTMVLETSGEVLMSVICPLVYSKVKGLVSTAAKHLVRFAEILKESSPGMPLNSSNATLVIYIIDKERTNHSEKVNYYISCGGN